MGLAIYLRYWTLIRISKGPSVVLSLDIFMTPTNKIGPTVAQCFYSCQLQFWRLIERKNTLIVMIIIKVHV